MFRHVVMFRWSEASSPEHIADLERALSRLPGELADLRRYAYGSDAGINEGNFDFAVVAEFDDSAGYLAYRDHDEHARIIQTLIAPYLEARTVVQFDFED